MNLNKKSITQILLITCLTVLFYVFIQNFPSVWNGLSVIVSSFTPIIIGICIAFVVNLPMSFIEKKLFPDKITSKHKWINKIKRPVSLILGWLFIILIFTIFLMLIIPELYKAIMNFSQLLPYYTDSFVYNITKWLDSLHINTMGLKDFDWNSLSMKIADYLESAGTALFGTTVTFTTGLFSSILNILLGFVFSCYFLLSKEGIRFVKPKQQHYLRWDECNFIGIYHFGVPHTTPGLIISKHVPKRDERGNIPRQYPWPHEETMDLTGFWCFLSEDDRRNILRICGGMKG